SRMFMACLRVLEWRTSPTCRPRKLNENTVTRRKGGGCRHHSHRNVAEHRASGTDFRRTLVGATLRHRGPATDSPQPGGAAGAAVASPCMSDPRRPLARSEEPNEEIALAPRDVTHPR